MPNFFWQIKSSLESCGSYGDGRTNCSRSLTAATESKRKADDGEGWEMAGAGGGGAYWMDVADGKMENKE